VAKITFDKKLVILLHDRDRLYDAMLSKKYAEGPNFAILSSYDIKKCLNAIYDEAYNAFGNIIEKHGAYISSRSLNKILKYISLLRESFENKLNDDISAGTIILNEDWEAIEKELTLFDKKTCELMENIQNAIAREKKKEAWNNRIPTMANIVLTIINIILTALGICIQFLIKNNY